MTLAVFSGTLFVSAFLMFAVQPMAGKMLLPLVGGSPAGWIVAMAFFQVMLLLGYLLAHYLSRFAPRRHAVFYLAALAVGGLFMPVALNTRTDSLSGPAQVFFLLTQALAVPFIALSASSSTLQRLFTMTDHRSSDDPYFLYVASNLGSFAGLLLYPVLIEPLLGLKGQSWTLALGYILLFALGAACLSRARNGDVQKPRKQVRHIDWNRRGLWMALSFLPCCLLMSVTSYITTDIISAPFVWILPLALYFLTFVIAFAKKPVVPLKVMETAHPYVIAAGILVISLIHADWLYSWSGVAFYLAVFTAVALACHLRLAKLRPLDERQDLTAYYLMISVGGALGGVVNAFIIPNVLDRPLEFPLTLMASFLLHPAFRPKTFEGIGISLLLAVALLTVNVKPPHLVEDFVSARQAFFRVLALAILALSLLYRRAFAPSYVTLAAIAVYLASQLALADPAEIFAARNFFGTVRLFDNPETIDGDHVVLRTMRHGATIHGMQMQGDPRLEKISTAYYTRRGPLGDVFAAVKPHSVAVLGLGAGVTNCFSAPDRSFSFYEIDPTVVSVANSKFTFLSACTGAAAPAIYLGDGRLKLAARPDKYDLIIIDVFTGDNIPTHIVTEEALSSYVGHLRPGGTIAMNISNRYFELREVIAATAAAVGLDAHVKADVSFERPKYSSPSLWLVLTSHGEKTGFPARDWKTVAPRGDIRPWTDDYSTLLAALR